MSAVDEHKATSGIVSLASRMASTSTVQRKSSGSSGSPVSASSLPPTELFPLEGLLEELLHQEAELWRRNELLMQSLRPVSGVPGSSPELEVTDVVSIGSALNSSQQSEDGQYEIDKRLYLIKYGKLSRTVHKYFRRLEQRHACLYLTATRAKRDRLRHVERHEDTSEGPPELHSSTNAVPAENGRQLVNLRDDETHVYRCALMCAQFPMLSAPDPPEGGSPTPPPPTLPLRFTDVIGSAASAARTVPDDFLTSLPPDRIAGASSGIPTSAIPNGHLPPSHQLPNGLGPGEPELNQDTSDRQKKRSRYSKRMNRTSSSGSKGSRVSPESPEVKVKTHDRTDGMNGVVDRPNPTDPIPIVRTGSKKLSRRKRDSLSMVNGDASQLAKLPAVDSDEEDELVQLTSNKQPNESSTDHLGREHPFSPMVNREMLGNLVRRAFHQTEEQQTNFEQMLKHEYGRRSKGEILAKELAGQLQVLENNAHPFYKPKLFVTRNGYDLWLQSEKQRVRNMIDKFWHFSLPRPQLWRHYNPTDYHKAYGILLQKVICCESRTDRREPVHSGKTPSSPLSPTSLRLLTEFGLRYGVGELYRRIIYLDYLAKHFDYEIWYIKHCTEELRGIRELLPRSRNKITAVRKEMEMLRATVHLLHGQTDNSLTRIDRLFIDSDPKEGVASLIELLAEVLDAEQSLFGKKVRPVEDWLKRYLRSGFILRYERRKEIAADETIQSRTAHPFVLTPTLINSILLDTRDEVYDYKEKFQSVFRPYFDIVPFAKEEFYRLMCADACVLCASVIHRQESRQSVSLEMLGLMYRLNERDQEWENVIPSESQIWRQKFVDLALIWMEVFGKQISKWVVTSVAQDQWMMLSLINPPFTSRESTDFPDRGLSSPLRSLSADAYRPSPKFVANASVRLSPFPSPIAGDMGSAFSPAPKLMGGAFTPYKRPVLKRPVKSPVLSEGSGAITDNSSPCAGSSTTSIDRSTCGSSITGELSDILVKGTKKHNEKDTPAESLLKFSQSAPEHQPYEFDTIGEHVGNEIEVSVSVYSGYDPTDDASPTPAEAADKTILQPQTTPRDSPDGRSHDSSANMETSTQLADQQSSTLATTATIEASLSVSGTSDHNGTLEPVLNESLEPVHQNPVDHQDKQPSAVSTGAAQLDGEVATMNHDGPTKATVNSSEGGLSGITVLPKVAVVHRANRGDHSKKHKTQRQYSNGDNSDYVSSIDSRLRVGAKADEHVVKFGNMLDHCNSEGSDADTPKLVKPTVVRPSGIRTKSDLFKKRGYQSATGTDEFHIPPASVGTVSELADWRKKQAYSSYAANGSSSGSNVGSSSHTSLEASQDTLKETSDGEASLEPHSSASCVGGPYQAFLFPVSNSPMDIVTMLVRLASFTGTLLGVLIPKLKPSTLTAGKSVNEYAPDVAAAREQANQQLRFAENTRKELLKKLHRTMLGALRLYADNLLCMDLCGWSGVDAIKLLGEEKVHGLKRRKDVGEIWGCRHMVEARHGLHPNGLPCQKRTSSKEFKSITRDMCVRINNIHTMINIFEALEEHLHSCMRTALPKPISAFGYVSSDPGELSPRPMTDKPLQPNPHRTLPDNETTSEGPASVKETRRGLLPSSLPLGSMESEDTVRGMIEGRKPDIGFKSRESDQLLEYLRTTQHAQFRLICIRMNHFFKPALSLLMDLKLRDCSIEKRLRPLMTFLTRHRNALQKYIYKDCFNTIMEYLWDYILRDLEDEAVKLRTHKQPVTDRAQMLNQTLSHLIQFMYNRGDGLPLELLTSSSEYLQGLLDIMTRSTDQLMSIFSRLSAPQFARGHFDISKAPVPIDGRVLHTLRLQLHAIKKCFSGKEFVDKVLEVGRKYDSVLENLSDNDSPGSFRRSASLGGSHVFSPTGQPIEYTTRYACEVGQFLLKERMLIQLPKGGTRDDNPSLTPQQPRRRHQLASSSFDHPDISFESSYSHDYSPGMRRSTLGSRGTGASSAESVGRGTRRDGYQYRYHPRDNIGRIRDPAPEFMNSPTTFYKFIDSEDKEQSSQYRSEILVASSHIVLGPSTAPKPASPANATGQGFSRQPHLPSRTRAEAGEDQTEFMNARGETLFLVFDLLVQRAKKEKRAKQFLQTPPALEVQGQRRANGHTSCDLIIKV